MAKGGYQIGEINQLLVHVALSPGFALRLDEMTGLWTDIRRTCASKMIRHVLVEGDRPSRDMNARDAQAHDRLLAEIRVPPLRVALCLYGYEQDELTQHFVRYANGGRASVQIFDDLSAALRWLGA